MQDMLDWEAEQDAAMEGAMGDEFDAMEEFVEALGGAGRVCASRRPPAGLPPSLAHLPPDSPVEAQAEAHQQRASC